MQTVAAAYLKGFVDTCVQMGADPAVLLAPIGGDAAILSAPFRRFDCACVLEILGIAERILDRPDIGLEVGRHLRPRSLLDLGYGVIACSTVREAMQFNAHYQPINQQLGRTKLTVADGFARIQWTSFKNDPEYMRLATEAVFAGYANIGRWLTWVFDEPIAKMRFRHARPAYDRIARTIFAADIDYGADRDEMLFSADIIDRHLPQANPDLVKVLAKRLDVQLEELNVGTPLERDVYLYLQSELTDGPPAIAKVATTMRMPERTLRRRLSAVGTSYRDLLEAARRDACEVYLQENGRTVAEIAQLLGYSEQSAFTRAFKSWFGSAPSQHLAR